jgi:hypothetical protein
MSLWDEGGGSPWQPFYRGAKGVASRPRMVAGQPAHLATIPPLCPKGVVVEIKREIVERKGARM